jgi:hypothetical protein
MAIGNNGTALPAGYFTPKDDEDDFYIDPDLQFDISPGVRAAVELGFYDRSTHTPGELGEPGTVTKTTATDEQALRTLQTFSRETGIPMEMLIAAEQSANPKAAIDDLLSGGFGPGTAVQSRVDPSQFIAGGLVPGRTAGGEVRPMGPLPRFEGMTSADQARNLREGIMAGMMRREQMQAVFTQRATQLAKIFMAPIAEGGLGLPPELAYERASIQAADEVESMVYAPGPFSPPTGEQTQTPAIPEGVSENNLGELIRLLMNQYQPAPVAPLSVRYQ